MADAQQIENNTIDRQNDQLTPWIVASLSLLAVCFLRTVFNPLWPINHDCAMYLEAGQLLLQGKIPYVDFIDLNPPLVFYLSAIPAFISKNCGLDLFKTFAAIVWLLALLSWLLSFFSLRLNAVDKKLSGPLLLGTGAISLLVGEWGEFGQRQHLAALGIVPFIICRWLRWQSDTLRVPILLAVASGILMGLMLSLVPQYILIPAAVEVYFQTKRPNLKSLFFPEMIAFELTVALYAVLLFTMPGAAREALWQRWIPLTGQGYAAYNGDWMSFTTFPFIFGSVPLFLIGLALAAKYRSSLTMPLIIWYLAAYTAVLVQLKGWYNHYIPMFAASLLFCAVQIKSWADAGTRSQMVALSATLACFVLCTLPSCLLRQSWHYPTGELETIKKETRPGDKVIVLSAAVPDIYPVILQAGCVNGSRFLFLFPVEMLRYEERNAHTDKEREKAKADLKQVLHNLEEDIDKSKPKLILIPCGNNDYERKISMVVYFRNEGLIDKIQSHYNFIGECRGRKNCFAVWQRK